MLYWPLKFGRVGKNWGVTIVFCLFKTTLLLFQIIIVGTENGVRLDTGTAIQRYNGQYDFVDASQFVFERGSRAPERNGPLKDRRVTPIWAFTQIQGPLR